MAEQVQFLDDYDPRQWQVARSRHSFLLTWAVEPAPVDAGVPERVQQVIAEALCALGRCWFPGDPGGGRIVASPRVRRGVASRTVRIIRADCAAELRPAFESGAHDWTQAAQWIVVGAPELSDQSAAEVVAALLKDWELPQAWPDGVLAVVQAGVDGDAAAVHCGSAEVRAAVRASVERLAGGRSADSLP